jgi:glutathione transport system permease protein
MFSFLIKRLLGLIPTLLLVSVLVFAFVHMIPGDPARLAAGPEADLQTVERIRHELGLDKPLHYQFIDFFSKAIQGDFGVSCAPSDRSSTKSPNDSAPLSG